MVPGYDLGDRHDATSHEQKMDWDSSRVSFHSNKHVAPSDASLIKV